MALFRKSSFAIDFSDNSVKAIELRGRNGGMKIPSFASFNLKDGLIVDGKIADEQGLITALREGLMKNEKFIFSSETCFFTIPDAACYIDLVEVKNGEDVAQAVTDFAAARFPITPEKIIFDWDVVAETDASSDVMVVACEREVVAAYTKVLKNAGLNPVLAEPQILAAIRAQFVTEACEELKPQMVVDIGHAFSTLTVYDECSIKLSTTFLLTGKGLTKEIQNTIGGAEDKAMKLKKKYGLSLTVKGKSKKRVLQSAIDDGIIQIQKVAKQYENKTGKKVEKVLLTGKTVDMPYLKQYLSKKMDIAVEIVDPTGSVSNSKENAKKLSKERGLGVLGVGLRSLNLKIDKEINLVQKLT